MASQSQMSMRRADALREGETEPSAAEGWRSLDDLSEDGVPVEGLLSNGRVTEAEWWGPVPLELQTTDSDGSGWAWDCGGWYDTDTHLIAWRPYAVAPKASPPSSEGEGSRDEP